MQNINWLGVIVAALAGFFLGAIWFNQKVFGMAWMRGLGLSEEQLAGRNMMKIMGLALVAYVVMALNLGLFLQGRSDIQYGASLGFHVGLGAVAMMLAVFYLFEQRSLKIFLINAGYAVATLTIMGTIIVAL